MRAIYICSRHKLSFLEVFHGSSPARYTDVELISLETRPELQNKHMLANKSSH